MSRIELSTTRLLSTYLIDDLNDIVMSYSKKCLWEYKTLFPHKEEVNSCSSFDQYISSTIQKPVCSFRWIENWTTGNDALFLGFCFVPDMYIPVSKENDHEKVYTYLKHYFDFL